MGFPKSPLALLGRGAPSFSPRPCTQGRGVGVRGSAPEGLPLTPTPHPCGARGFWFPLSPAGRGACGTDSKRGRGQTVTPPEGTVNDLPTPGHFFYRST